MQFRDFLESSAANRGIPMPTTKSTNYGYWLSPTGELYPVPYQGHEKEGFKITDKLYKQEINRSYHSNIDFLFEKGWARIVNKTSIDCDYPLTPQQKETILEFFKDKDVSRLYVKIPGCEKFILNYEGLFNAILNNKK